MLSMLLTLASTMPMVICELHHSYYFNPTTNRTTSTRRRVWSDLMPLQLLDAGDPYAIITSDPLTCAAEASRSWCITTVLRAWGLTLAHMPVTWINSSTQLSTSIHTCQLTILKCLHSFQKYMYACIFLVPHKHLEVCNSTQVNFFYIIQGCIVFKHHINKRDVQRKNITNTLARGLKSLKT